MIYARVAGIAITLFVLIGAGWMARGWFEDAQRLTATKAAQAAVDTALDKEGTVAQQVEKRLAQQKITQRVIDRGVIREIEKPIYQRVCLGDDGIRLLNAAAQGRAPDTAKPTDKMPGDSPDTDGRHGTHGTGDDDAVGESIP